MSFEGRTSSLSKRTSRGGVVHGHKSIEAVGALAHRLGVVGAVCCGMGLWGKSAGVRPRWGGAGGVARPAWPARGTNVPSSDTFSGPDCGAGARERAAGPRLDSGRGEFLLAVVVGG